MIKSSWYAIPAAFFLAVNFLVSPIKIFFFRGLIYFLFFVFLFLFLRKINLDRIIKFSLGGTAGIIFIYGIVQKFVLFPRYLETLEPQPGFYSQALFSRIESGRIFSIFALPTLYAVVCVVFILFFLHYLIVSRPKMFWALLLVLGLFNLILTQSFGGLLYLSLGVLFYLFLSGILNLRFLAPVLMLLSLFFFILVGLRFSEVRTLEPIKQRLSNWNQAVRIIESNPFWGLGLGNYEAGVSVHIRSGESPSIFSHNFFLQFISETGLIFSVWLLLLVIFSRRKLNPPDQQNRVIYLTAFCILIFYNLIDIGLYFFSSALLATIVLSQIYFARPEKNGKDRRYLWNLFFIGMAGLFLIWDGVSDNFQKGGEFHLNQRNLPEAKKAYRKSLAINPFQFKSRIGLGMIALSEENIRQSEYHLQKALHIYPDSAFSHFQMSRIAFRQGKMVDAFRHAKKACSINRLNEQYRDWCQKMKNLLQQNMNQRGAP